MSQEMIMNLLDQHPRKYYSAKDIFSKMNGVISLKSIYRNLKNIVKRGEYEAILGHNTTLINNTRSLHMETMYGHIMEEKQ